ncbi:outer membrane receptor protein involved in Fe transport [Marinirhabdus gelatinilytica]|uniref:Outer membrane receptor protein involved in Fe transport n=1 Tax=Marinirhabdus gelatinilytica TaxID=1703343 RepID=A0A370QEY8_9FLAO|nr:TonB-dependent receptor [Marinirhabdus gelatinilytica]RDK86829.1 outer membrane receptor protein involved in Fe transport [Marinirhabdus gelatinilytica]
MKNLLLLGCLLFTALVFSQERFTLSGVVSEAATGETLIGVNVIIPSLQTGTITNEYGFYSITLPEGTYEVYYSNLGFTTVQKTIMLNENTVENVGMDEDTQQLDEVVIKADVEALNIRKPEMSVNRLTAGTIKKIPVVLGEKDVIKAITLLPGVTNAGEGASGFNVRGGAADQNLILLDEATLYNSSHLFGFFSVFNPDAIKDLTLYKGGIPARYGGRISSVLDIYQKDGNLKRFEANGGVGLVASRLLLEAPIKKDTASFLVGGRSSYAHLFLPLFDNDNIAYFYDLNTKISYNLNQNNKLFLSGYFGRDVFEIADSFSNNFGNATINLRWNHLFSDKLFSNLSLIYSDYYYGLELGFVEFDFDSGIQNFNLKYDLTNYVSDNLKLQYGFNGIYYKFNPGEINPTTPTSGINPFKLTQKYATENAVYADAEIEITDNLSVQAGLRVSTFARLGQDELNVYENNNPILYDEALDIYQKATPIDTVSFNRSEVLESFVNLEPRVAVAYQLNETSSLKASYNRTAQYIHLISNTTSPTPFDIYAPSGTFIEPQTANQVAFGYFKKFEAFSLEAETFYKKINNRLDYVDDADLIANNAVEQILLKGEARAYGLELLLRKTTGKLQGWIAYTLSKSEQRTPGRTPEEIGINSGQWYNTAWDKPHDISITAQYELNNKWSFGANAIYQTGRPSTFPTGQYEYNNLVIPVYEARNSSRLSAFHHVDVSATWTPKPNNPKRWKSEWVFSVYNIYNRKNAASLSFRENTDIGQNEAVRLSIFGIIPSITYNFKF